MNNLPEKRENCQVREECIASKGGGIPQVQKALKRNAPGTDETASDFFF